MVEYSQTLQGVRSTLKNDFSLTEAERLDLRSQERNLTRERNQQRIINNQPTPEERAIKNLMNSANQESKEYIARKSPSSGSIRVTRGKYKPVEVEKTSEGYTRTSYFVVRTDAKGKSQRSEIKPQKVEYFDVRGNKLREKAYKTIETSGGNERTRLSYEKSFTDQGVFKKDYNPQDKISKAQYDINKAQSRAIPLSQLPKVGRLGIQKSTYERFNREVVKEYKTNPKTFYVLEKGSQLGDKPLSRDLVVGEGFAKKVSALPRKSSFLPPQSPRRDYNNNFAVFPTNNKSQDTKMFNDTEVKVNYDFGLKSKRPTAELKESPYTLITNALGNKQYVLKDETDDFKRLTNYYKKVGSKFYEGGKSIFTQEKNPVLSYASVVVGGALDLVTKPSQTLFATKESILKNPYEFAGQQAVLIASIKGGGAVIKKASAILPEVKPFLVEGSEFQVVGKRQVNFNVEGVNPRTNPEVFNKGEITYNFQQPKKGIFAELKGDVVDTTLTIDPQGNIFRLQRSGNKAFFTEQKAGSKTSNVLKYKDGRLIREDVIKTPDFFGKDKGLSFSTPEISVKKDFVSENLADNILFQKEGVVAGGTFELTTSKGQFLGGEFSRVGGTSKLSKADLSSKSLSDVNVEYVKRIMEGDIKNIKTKSSFQVVPKELNVEPVKLQVGEAKINDFGLTTKQSNIIFDELIVGNKISKARGSFELSTSKPAKVENVIFTDEAFNINLRVGGSTPSRGAGVLNDPTLRSGKININKPSDIIKVLSEEQNKKVSPTLTPQSGLITQNIVKTKVVNIQKVSSKFETLNLKTPSFESGLISKSKAVVIPKTQSSQRVSAGIFQEGIVKSDFALKDKTLLSNKQANIQKITIGSKIIQSERIKSVQDVKLKQNLAIKQNLGLKQDLIIKQDLRVNQKVSLRQKTALKQLITARSTSRFNTLFTTKTTTKTPIIPASGLGFNFNKQSAQGYDVFTKKKGKTIKINPKTYSKKQAEAFGRFFVDTTPRASFKVKKAVNRKIEGEFKGYSPSKNIFSKSKKSSFFVEKNKFRISTRGEVRGISFKGLEASRRNIKKVFL